MITEDERTILASRALKSGDLSVLGALMYASHDSLRDDYEVTVPPLDVLVDLVKGQLGTSGGARMTGGGFGGCIVALSPKGQVESIKREIDARYTALTGLKAQVYVCSPSEGARALSTLNSLSTP